MDDFNARQMVFVIMNQAEMFATIAEIEAIKAEIASMEAHDRCHPDTPYVENGYLDLAKQIKEKAQAIRSIAGQIGATAQAMV